MREENMESDGPTVDREASPQPKKAMALAMASRRWRALLPFRESPGDDDDDDALSV